MDVLTVGLLLAGALVLAGLVGRYGACVYPGAPTQWLVLPPRRRGFYHVVRIGLPQPFTGILHLFSSTRHAG